MKVTRYTWGPAAAGPELEEGTWDDAAVAAAGFEADDEEVECCRLVAPWTDPDGTVYPAGTPAVTGCTVDGHPFAVARQAEAAAEWAEQGGEDGGEDGGGEDGDTCPECGQEVEWESVQTGRAPGVGMWQRGRCGCPDREWRTEERGGEWSVPSCEDEETCPHEDRGYEPDGSIRCYDCGEDV